MGSVTPSPPVTHLDVRQETHGCKVGASRGGLPVGIQLKGAHWSCHTQQQGMSRSSPSLGTALVLLLSALSGGDCERHLHQIADAPAPSGFLRQDAKQKESNGALSTTCTFTVNGMAHHGLTHDS